MQSSIDAGYGVPIVKPLIILILVLTGLLILLFGKVFSPENDVDANSPSQQVASARHPLLPPLANSNSGQAPPTIDEYLLRQIVRENPGDSAAAAPTAAEHQLPEISSDLALAEDNQRRFEEVSQQIEYIASAGNISIGEMEALHTEIAHLDSTSRKLALRKLTQALNSGAIDGSF